MSSRYMRSFESDEFSKVAATIDEVVEDVDVGGWGVFSARYGSEDADCIYAEPGSEERERLPEFSQYVMFDAGVGAHVFPT